MSRIIHDDYRKIALLRLGHFERRRRGWRFGTMRIADPVVDRLIANGHAVRIGDQVHLAPKAAAQ